MADQQNLPGTSAAAQEESANMRLLSNTLAIIGFVIIAIIVLWGIYNLLKISGVSLPNWFSASPALQITAPKTVVSGQPFTVSWKNNAAGGGTYAFLYQCTTNFSFGAPGATGVLNKVPCGTSLTVGSSTSATMIPVLSGTATTSVPFTVVFTPQDGSAKTTGNTTIAISPAPTQQPSTPVKPSTPSTKPAQPTTSHATGSGPLVPHAASGPADLSVTILAVGYIDPASGALLMNRQPMPYDTVGVEFDIANVGGSASGSYTFAAHLPSQSGYTYSSPTQMSLLPGQHVVSTLRFTQLAPGGGIFTVVVSPAANDINASNNEAAQTIY